MFCGHNRKWTVGQIRIHYTKESEGATHVHACPQVPQEITQFYRDVRDTFLAQQKLKSAKAVSCLRDEMSLATLGSESSPQSSQGQPGSAGSKLSMHGAQIVYLMLSKQLHSSTLIICGVQRFGLVLEQDQLTLLC